MLKELIGAKLISIDTERIIVEKDNTQYIIDIIDDGGDCCGYNEINAKLLITDNSKPIITKITTEESDNYDGDSCNITFFGEYKPIAELDSFSYSGSGWGYGACVTLECKALDIDTLITSW